MGDHLVDRSFAFADRVIGDVLQPFMIEHRAGQHGAPDASAAMTIALTGLARAMVPILAELGTADQRAEVLTDLVEIVTVETQEYLTALMRRATVQ